MNDEKIGDWFVTVWASENGRHIALAKKETFVNGHPIYEPGELHIAIADTADEAKKILISELPLH